jgi:hypothetical protein
MHHRGTDNATKTDDDNVAFIWKLSHEISPDGGRLAQAKSVPILDLSHKRSTLAEASRSALKCDFLIEV